MNIGLKIYYRNYNLTEGRILSSSHAIKMSNHPDFVEIIPIWLKNLESRPKCDRDRKNPDLDSCCDILASNSHKRKRKSCNQITEEF